MFDYIDFVSQSATSLSLSLSLSMASNHSLCIVGAMDRLWFHQIVLLSEPISLLNIPQPISESLTYPSSSLSLSTLQVEEISSAVSLLPDEEISPDSPPISPAADSNDEEEEEKERSTSLINLSKTRALSSHSFSPSTQKRLKNLGSSGGVIRRLHKTMSCKNLGELELEEVKGFMDLGFSFKKEHLSPRMMSVIPGLQRLDEHELIDVAETELGNEERVVTRRPHLSEAWLIKRPDSPLLNLRMPRDVSKAADMKRHLRFWATTVAAVLEQES